MSGQAPAEKLYDGTALTELQLLVDGTLGNLVSANLRWLRLTMEKREQNDIPYVKDWLEEVENVLYAEFARSNYYEAMSEFFLDAASIGTGVMLVDENMAEKKMLFSTRHMKECYIAEARDGSVDTLYREFRMTNRQMGQVWPDEISQSRKDRIETNPFGTAHIIHAVFPRSERVPGKIDNKNKGWASIYIDKEFHAQDGDEKQFLDEGGYDNFPYLVWRWRKNSDEIYGRSPAIDAIGEVKRLNQMSKTSLTVAQLLAQPPMNIPRSMKGQERIVPRGYNYYTSKDEVISAIDLGQNYPVTKDQETELKEQLRDTFRTKMYMLQENLEGGPYTATEIHARMGEKTTVQGPMIGRLNSETLIPLIKLTYNISELNGLIPAPPPGLEEGGRIHIEFQGPLALQTKKYHQTQGIDNGMAFIGAMAELFPNSMINVDEDELMRQGMDAKGMPQKIIREVTEVDEIKAQIQAQQQAQQQAEQEAVQQQTLAQNADKLNKPVQKGSMLEGIGKAAAASKGGNQQGSR